MVIMQGVGHDAFCRIVYQGVREGVRLAIHFSMRIESTGIAEAYHYLLA